MSLRGWRRRVEAALLGVVVAVGMSYPLGMATGVPWIQTIGLALASSPIPAVFHYPEIAVRMRVELWGIDGRRREMELGPAEFSRLGGPMTRRVPYTLPAFSRLPRRIWTSIYRTGICDGGPLARELGIDFALRRVRLHIDYRREIYPESRSLEITCPR